MIDLNTEAGRAKVAELFLQDMNQPAIRLAVYRSFRRYAILRDQLIDAYTQKTCLPEEFFHSVIAQDMYKDLVG